ncbi:MAG: carbohydrate-binding protein [Bacteroidales bacterium]|nr:carbohydrate-binding protein [Bacteroidales bacterium]
MKLFKLLTVLILLTSSSLYSQGYLHRNGKYIYDGSGNEVILRGIGTGNWMLQEGYMMQTSGVAGTQHEFRAKLVATIGEEKTDSFYTVWLDSHFRRIDVDSMKSWGFNSVRVAMHYKWFTPPIDEEPVPGEITWLEKGFTMIDSLLDWCGDNEMYLILDLHGAPGGQGKDANISDYDPSKPSLWESRANKDKTIALWRKLAERYSQEPWIGGYDLINETNWTFPEGNNSQLRNLMVEITIAIREVDPNHIIFIEGNGFANDFSGMTPPWDDNMVYSFHKYWSYNTQESINFALNLRTVHNIPIWLGESGENSNVWFTSLIALLEKNRIGWSWWPVKKPGINNPLKVTVNSDYTNLVNYWKGTASNPGVDAAFAAVLQFAENHRLENCSFQKDVVDAMIRQPGTIETIPYTLFNIGDPVFASDYNLGRSGYAYLDNDSANFHLSTGTFVNWNQGGSYRNDGVDIQACEDKELSNGFNVGWTQDGEWMEYTVDVDSTAGYSLHMRSASGSGGSKVHLETGETAITPLIALPATQGWQNWQTTRVDNVILTRGLNKIRFIFDQGGSNLNYFRFTDPVALENVGFKELYASSSEDGYYINLTLNKPVTSPIGEVSPADFSVTCNNEPFEVIAIAKEENSLNCIRISLAEPLYYGGIIKLSYEGNSILNSDQLLEAFFNAEVVNKLPLRFNLPARIQAEDFSFNNGFVSESCSDAGGGLDMGYANPGDYLDYRVYVPESKYYTINFRVATIRASSQLIIRVGEGNTFTDLDTLTITSTGGWQTWKTLSTTVFLNEGRYTLRLYVRSGEYNTNWFQVASASGVGVNTQKETGLQIYPNPANDYIMVDLGGLSNRTYEITIYNALGQIVKTISTSVTGSFRIGTSDLGKGLFYVEVNSGNSYRERSKIIVL